jgi:D-threo-aldose 1-dehydrogenase
VNSVQLANGQTTTRLGFGCGPLHGGLEAGQSRRTIDIAFEAGIRHFDVAPSYGLGLIEGVLGQAMKGRRNEVTLTTKAGLPRPSRGFLKSAVRSVVKPVVGLVRGWLTADRPAREGPPPDGTFDVAGIEASLGESLARLQTGSVDMFLMHEMRPRDPTPELLQMLTKRQRAKTIGLLGIGTSRADAVAIAMQTPQLAGVQQFRWNVFEPRLTPIGSSLIITHGAIVPALGRLNALFAANPALRDDWSAALDLDLASPAILGDVLLGAALAENPNGIVLVHSRKPERIRRFVTVAKDPKWHASGRQLADLVAGGV